MVVHDDEHVFLIRQPREAVLEPDMLEIPAGRLDKPGEDPLPAAKRELAEEIGRAAAEWEHLKTFYPSVGVNRETVHLYRATGLSDAHADSGENERIELVAWPLSDLDGAIEIVQDAKTIIGLVLLREHLRSA
jgi:ADP-ribose pyrophosphatase